MLFVVLLNLLHPTHEHVDVNICIIRHRGLMFKVFNELIKPKTKQKNLLKLFGTSLTYYKHIFR